MSNPVYVPILKGKEGEYAALEVLSSVVKKGIFPLIEIPPIPYDFANEGPAKTLQEHTDGIPDRLARALQNLPFFLDTSAIGDDERISNGQLVAAGIFHRSEAFGLRPTPVVYTNSSADYRAFVKKYTQSSGSGACFRLTVKDFEEEIDIEAEIERLLSESSNGIKEVDVLVDLGDLTASASPTLIARSIFSLLPYKETWRRLILAAASFPEDLSDVTAATIVKLPRVEWDLWKSLQRRPNALPRKDLIFGDYAMSHPIAKSLDPRTMRMSANIRYTTENEWLILKGRNVRQYGFEQYFELCRLLVERPEYCGRDFSWGDSFIADCAEATQGPGNATTWRKVGVNHHITLVATELSNSAISA